MHISTWHISAANHIKKETKVFNMIYSNKLVVFFSDCFLILHKKNLLYNFADIQQQKFRISQIYSFLLFENHNKLFFSFGTCSLWFPGPPWWLRW